MERNKITTVIWDCDKTLWNHDPYNEEMFIDELGIDKKELSEFKAQFFFLISKFNTYFITHKVSYDKTCLLIEEYMPILSKYNKSGKDFLDIFINKPTHILNPGAFDAMKYTFDSGYRNIILSDWFLKSQERHLKKFQLFDFVENIFTCDDSYLKANPKIASKIVSHPSETIMIGDSLRADIAFANQAGINSIWYNPAKLANDSKYAPTYTITSLFEVMDIL